MEVYIVVLFWRLFQLCCNIIAEHDFTIVPLYTCTPWTIYGGARTGNDMETTSNDISTTTQRNRSSHTLTQEHYELSTTLRDLGPAPSLDLSLYPLLQAPWTYRTLLWTGRSPPVAWTSITPVSLSPTIWIRRTNVPKFTYRRYQTPTIFQNESFILWGSPPQFSLKNKLNFKVHWVIDIMIYIVL
jgi:hypothetical protein